MKSNEKMQELVELLTKISDPQLMGAFLEDLLTQAEIEDITIRLQIIKMLDAGTPQREIAQKLGVSISKVTRGSHTLNESTNGFKKILQEYLK